MHVLYRQLQVPVRIFLYLFVPILRGKEKNIHWCPLLSLREMWCPSKEKKISARKILYQKFSYNLRCIKELMKSWTLLIKVGNHLTDSHIFLNLNICFVLLDHYWFSLLRDIGYFQFIFKYLEGVECKGLGIFSPTSQSFPTSEITRRAYVSSIARYHYKSKTPSPFLRDQLCARHWVEIWKHKLSMTTLLISTGKDTTQLW